jgi:zinc transport system ATP-binding protein
LDGEEVFMTTGVTTKTAVAVRNLTVVKEGVRILDDISFEVAEGCFFGLVGPNGGGKTTLLRVILGLEAPAGGEVRVLDQPPGRSKDVGYLPQKVSFDPRFPARGRDVVRMALARRGKRNQDRDVQWALELTGMTGKAHLPLRQLSGGEQQRLFLARALVRRPRLLVLDEPTLGVDAQALDGFIHGLLCIREEKTMTLLIVSHEHAVIRYHTDVALCVSHTAHFLGKSRDVTPELLARTVGTHRHVGKHAEPEPHDKSAPHAEPAPRDTDP